MLGVGLQVDVELGEVRLQGDLAQAGEKPHVEAPQRGEEVADDDVDEDGDQRGVAVRGVVGELLQPHEGHVPEHARRYGRRQHPQLDPQLGRGRSLAFRVLFQVLDEGLVVRVVVGAEHTAQARPVVQAGPELPLVHQLVLVVVELEHEPQGPEELRAHAWDLEDEGVEEDVGGELSGHPPAVGVPGGEHAHEGVDGEEPVGVHGADVVQHVLVVGHHHDGHHQEVHAEQHL